MRHPILAALLLPLAGCPFCTVESSATYETSGINASMSAGCDGEKTTVVVTLSDPSDLLTVLDLADGDELSAVVGGETKRLSASAVPELLGASYSADFDACPSGDEVRVLFSRRNHDSASNSRATLPQEFAPVLLSKLAYSRARDAIQISWSSGESPDPMHLSFSGDCIDPWDEEVEPGVRSFTLPVGTLKEFSHSDRPVADECTVKVTLTRTRDGSVDPGFHAGSFDAEQRRTLTFTSTP